jgi:hypothetical protein
MIRENTARILDTTALKASQLGHKLGGDKGAHIADSIVNATLGGLRAATGQPCTHPDGHDEHCA